MPLSSQSRNSITRTLDSAVQNGAPGLVFHAVDGSGRTLISHATGNLGASTASPMDSSQTLFWISSCTELVTTIAVLQLVEQGKIPLDDENWLARIAPEIKAKKVFRAGTWGVGEEQERGVTVGMLLSHTAGFGYQFVDVRCGDGSEEGEGKGWIEGMGGDVNDILGARMVNQPGSVWEYGVSFFCSSLHLAARRNEYICVCSDKR